MGLDENLDFDYKNLLNIFGEFRGFKELLKFLLDVEIITDSV